MSNFDKDPKIMRLAYGLSRLFLFLAGLALLGAGLAIAWIIVDVVTSSNSWVFPGVVFSSDFLGVRGQPAHGDLSDLGVSAVGVVLFSLLVTCAYAYSAWRLSRAFEQVADRQALTHGAGTDMIRSGVVTLGALGLIHVVRTAWLLTLPREGLTGSVWFWAIGEELPISWIVIALVFIVMGRIIREAADLAAEHELTV